MLDSVSPPLGFFRLLLLRVLVPLGSAWRESGKWLHYSPTARERVAVRASNLTPKNTVRKPTGEALAAAPAQTAKVPTPFSF
uniref:Secreted protein n=1 Tax=Setaria viridis TaxID=4556 RepID=A0A4U6TBY8_SETVI|nr:hypothetical protein SEVIR_9G536450v2 [Setaria viridis]